MSGEVLTSLGVITSIFVLYKIIDRLVRLPQIGRYNTRYVLITGCGQGIGYEAVKRLDQLGCKVFAGCRREESVLELKKTFSERVDAFQMDVSDKESVRKAFQYVSSKLPSNKGLWGLINNAAIAHVLPLHLFTMDMFEKTLAVNLIGAVDVTLTFLPLVKKARGRIVNISSYFGRAAIPEVMPYSSAKFGLESFSDSMRRALCTFGVRVIVVEPGFVRITQMSEIENHVKFLEGLERNGSVNNSSQKESERLGRWMTRVGLYTPMDEVIDAYEHALFGLFPRARYVVGIDAKAFIFLQIFPEWFSDWVYRLTSVGL